MVGSLTLKVHWVLVIQSYLPCFSRGNLPITDERKVELSLHKFSPMRNISFFLTRKQIAAQTKTVTRRAGWKRLTRGTLLQPVEKGQGLKKGEKVQRIGPPIRVIDVRREPLNQITQRDVEREGFPDMTPEEFIQFYCKSNKCGLDELVTRIEFE